MRCIDISFSLNWLYLQIWTLNIDFSSWRSWSGQVNIRAVYVKRSMRLVDISFSFYWFHLQIGSVDVGFCFHRLHVDVCVSFHRLHIDVGVSFHRLHIDVGCLQIGFCLRINLRSRNVSLWSMDMKCSMRSTDASLNMWA